MQNGATSMAVSITTNIYRIIQKSKIIRRDALSGKGFGYRPYSSIWALLSKYTKENFDRQQSPDGISWKPMSEATRAIREKKGFAPEPLLQRSGNLLRSLLEPKRGDDFDFINKTITMGSKLPYAIWQQEGFKGVEARPYLGLNDRQIQDLENTAAEAIEYVLDQFFH